MQIVSAVIFATLLPHIFCHEIQDFSDMENSSTHIGKRHDERECRKYHDIKDSSKWCSFINVTPNCAMDEGFVNYIKVAFCDFNPKYFVGVAVMYAVWLLFLFVGLGTTAEGYFCPSLEFIAKNLKMSHNIAGLTIVAFGNGAPDIFSAIAAFTNSNPSTAGVAIGALLGAALLVTTVVAGLVATTQAFDVAKRPFIRDMIFFMAAVFWLFYLLSKKKITLPHSIGFLVFYCVYVATALIGRYINQKQRAREAALEEETAAPRILSSPSNSDDTDERSQLLSPSKLSPGEGGINNNLDNDCEWMDVNLRSHYHHSPKHINSEISPREESVEPNECIPTSEDETELDDDFKNKSAFFIFLVGLNPVQADDWRNAKVYMKLLLVIQIPWNIVCKLTIPLVLADEPRRAWNRPLHCLCLVIAPVFCVFATKGNYVYLGDVFPLWAFLLIIGSALALAVWFTSTNVEYPRYQWAFAYFGFVVAIIWTYVTANEIVNLIQTFGVILNVNNVVMGLTFLAWGNSISDVVADLTLARQGCPRMSLSACFGAPLFNILLGIGLSCTISTIKTGKPIVVDYTLLEAVLCGSVLLGLSVTFVAVPCFLKFRLKPYFGWILICIYVILLTLCLLAGLKVF